jgi:predicted ATPase
MSPVTWEQHTPTPELDVEIDTEQRTEQTPDFELSDFGDDTHERTTIAVAAYDFRPKFTGRDNLITQLHKLLGSAFASPPQLAFVTVVGEPGMGKSRIIGELLARVTAEHPDLLVLAGTADDHAHAYGPIARALTSYFGLVGGEDPTTSRERIQEVVAKIVPAPRALEIVHLVAHLLRVPFDDSPITAPLLDSPARFEARLFMALKRLLAAASQHRPLVVFVENLELCENDTIHFLQYLATGLRDHQVAIIGTATPLVHTRHSTFGDGEVAPVEIALGSLSPTESEDLLRELCKQLS